MEEELVLYKDYFDHIFDNVDRNIRLDENQRKAILVDKNHVLAIAGAGSGKTTTMSAKVKFLIEKRNVLPAKIAVISFTNKATEEIAHRIQKDFGFKEVEVYTFHKLGLKILREQGIQKLKIINDQKKFSIFYQYLSNLFEDKKIFQYYIQTFKDQLKFESFYKSCQTINDYHLRYCEKYYLDVELSSEEKYFENFIEKTIFPFISLYKGNEDNDILLKKLTKNRKFQYLKELYNYYQEYLKKHCFIDFDDMILLATDLLSIDHKTFHYQYIIIDEYQDISLQRYALIQKFVQLFGTKIMAVGDDFQSIFGFAGARIDLFTDFTDNFSDAKIIPIENTYRNSQELVDIASKFILKNTHQFKKNLRSVKRLDHPIEIYFYKHDQEESYLWKSLLISNIIKEIYQRNKKQSILLLGRYQEDCSDLLKSQYFKKETGKLICNLCQDANITFLTVHSSKGLGFDQVILLNALNSKFGFPSQIEDDELFQSLKNVKNEEILFPEERRLFYVALTRTKNKFYIISPYKNYSIFVEEIMKESNVFIHKNVFSKKEEIPSKYFCPKCSEKIYRKNRKGYLYYECNNCLFKTTNIKRQTPIYNCPKCQELVMYRYTNSNGYDIFKCINEQCMYTKKIFSNKIWEKIKKFIQRITQ